jgi:hypothetical protein
VRVSAPGGFAVEPQIVDDPSTGPIVAWDNSPTSASSGFPMVFLTQLDEARPDPGNGHNVAAPLGPPRPTRIMDALSRSPEIAFSLANGGATRLDVFDVSGRRVASSDLGWLEAGDHSAAIGGLAGRPAGVYVARLTQGAQSWTSRVVLLR